jgi:hypothetical protein
LFLTLPRAPGRAYRERRRQTPTTEDPLDGPPDVCVVPSASRPARRRCLPRRVGGWNPDGLSLPSSRRRPHSSALKCRSQSAAALVAGSVNAPEVCRQTGRQDERQGPHEICGGDRRCGKRPRQGGHGQQRRSVAQGGRHGAYTRPLYFSSFWNALYGIGGARKGLCSLC